MSKKVSKKFDSLLLGAWEPIHNVKYEIFSLQVPVPWRQVAQSLASLRTSRGHSKYPSVPVSSLDPIITASFPQIIKTGRYGWQRSGVPWIFATEKVNLSSLADFVKDWLREEFSWCLGENEVNSRLQKLNNNDWQWDNKVISNYSWNQPGSNYKIDFRYQIVSDYLAKEFLKQSKVIFDGDIQRQLTFYRVVRLDKGAELMSWPPTRISVIEDVETDDTELEKKASEAYISFVITFKVHTVPWRDQPMIYHHLSVRRWVIEPLEKFPYKGATAYIADNRRWLDGSKQPFSFIPLKIKQLGKPAKYPKAISELLKINDSPIPELEALRQQPVYNWSEFGEESTGIQVAISYDSRYPGDAPCKPGVSPLDLASLDKAIQEHLSTIVKRVGEAVEISKTIHFWEPGKPHSRDSEEPKKRDDSSTPMLRPKIVAPAVLRPTNLSITILILWQTEQCRDALIAEICQLLYLSPTGLIKHYKTSKQLEGEEQFYKGELGSIQILTQHIQDLAQKLDIDTKDKNRRQQRTLLMEKRINEIVLSLPKPNRLSGALIEIKTKKSYFPPESDPKLALRIGAVQAGYVNQHIHALKTSRKKTGEEYVTKSSVNRVQRAVSDLLRQFGILPAPLIDPEKDGINTNLWLTCFDVVRRTRKTTANNKASTVALMLRVNPVTASVEITTPSLFPKWVSYPSALQYLTTEKWDSNSYTDEIASEVDDETQKNKIKHEQQLLNKFVHDCLRDCLNTPIEQGKNPNVLFMVESQNARKMLTWLQNPNLPVNTLPKNLNLTESEKNRLWVVRLRVPTNGEVPVGIDKHSPGKRGSISRLFCWQNVCDSKDNAIYLSLRKLLNTEQNILRKSQSRLDNGDRPAGNPKLLEIAIVHHPGIERYKLASFVHNLRNRWPYFADDVSLPFPFPFIKLAKEYAVSAKDVVEVSNEELEDSEDIIDSD